MSVLFLMDPIENINPSKDTTLLFIRESISRGETPFYMPQGGITIENGKFFFSVQEILIDDSMSFPIILKDPIVLDEVSIKMIFIRTDPPFDTEYLNDTWLLDLIKDRVLVVNNPTGIRQVNEKLWCSKFVDFVPETLITRHRDFFLSFLKKHNTVILKPLNGFGGKGIMKLDKEDPNLNSIFEVMTNDSNNDVMIQRYIPESKNGDKRILLFNGEPLGSVLRLHGDFDHRNNFFAGGTPQKSTLTARDLEICRHLGPFLRELGLYFVGIDIIGDYLIEVNVTSPTCMQEINRFEGVFLEKIIFEELENIFKTTLKKT